MVARMPPGHGVEGKLEVSLASHGAPDPPVMRSSAWRQRWQIPGYVPFLLRLLGLPASMRKPCGIVRRDRARDDRFRPTGVMAVVFLLVPLKGRI
jgi:hypothetical protein